MPGQEQLPVSTEPRLRRIIETMQREAQLQAHTVFNREPFAKEIPEGGIVLARISGTSYLYSKVQGVRARVALTDRP